MSDPARIGFLTTSFPRHEDDTAGRFVLGQARSLASRGHRVDVVVPEPAEPAGWGDPAAPWLGGVRVAAAPYARPRELQRLFFGAGVPDNLARFPARAALIPTAVAGLYLTARRLCTSWDALVSHWLVPSAVVGAHLPGADSRTHLAIAHSGDLHLLGRLPLGSELARAVLRGADRVGLVAGGQRDEVRELVGRRVWDRSADRVVAAPMGIDPDELCSRRDREELRAEIGLSGFCVLFLGRLVPIKGVDLLIRAVAGRPDWQLVVAGDGPSRGDLERLAREVGANASFVGEVGPTRRAELLAACDTLTLPSRRLEDGRHEGLPLVLLEAMAAGAAVVAAETGGVAELVRHEVSGLLVPTEDVGALGDSLERLADDPGLADRLSRVARGVANERDWRRLAPRFEGLLGLGPAPAP